jgi:hypothetical protein
MKNLISLFEILLHQFEESHLIFLEILL